MMRDLRRHRVIALALVVLLDLSLCLWVIVAMFLPAGSGREVIVRIPRGSSAVFIARVLDKKGIIRSATGFVVLAQVRGQSRLLKPGAYKLSPRMTPSQIMDKIVRGDVCARWVTFPEGFNIWQIAERLEAEGLADANRFVELARTRGTLFKTRFPHPGNNLEGYLFPDTYLLPIGAKEEFIIQLMLDTFYQRVNPVVAGKNVDLHKIVTLASLIEREARVPKDRPLISAVLRNRLAKGMRLECDATVLYALGRHKSRVLYADLKVDSPYNTYLYAGLPPGPIANPGLASIKAALYPARVDFLYYTARADGTHIFTKTLSDHIKATRFARRERSLAR